jgi:hypothetical protein
MIIGTPYDLPPCVNGLSANVFSSLFAAPRMSSSGATCCCCTMSGVTSLTS